MAKEEHITNSSVAVNVTNTKIAERSFQQRSAIIITNTSAAGQKIYITVGQESTIGIGTMIAPGGVYSDTRDGVYLPSNEQINAIADAANATVAVQERIMMNSY